MMVVALGGALFQLKAPTAMPTTALEMVMAASPLSKAVLVLLAVLSLFSWAIMFAKWSTFRRLEKAGREFVHDFERADTLEEATIFAKRARPNPYVSVYNRAMRFLDSTNPALAATADRRGRLSASQVEALRMVIDAESSDEREKLGAQIPWLATIGSVSPLIGLFGTVVGVIAAFLNIGTKGSGNINAVAPGIAEALIATAAALAVAIPAAFAYNIFASRLNRLDNMLEGFGSELIALMARAERI